MRWEQRRLWQTDLSAFQLHGTAASLQESCVVAAVQSVTRVMAATPQVFEVVFHEQRELVAQMSALR